MAEKATIARPYARAAFAFAREASALAVWSEALAGAAAVVGDARISRLIGNPKIAAAQLIDLIAEILGGKLDAKVRNFLEELARNRRLGVLPQIADMFEAMRAEIENIADVQVTSAEALNDAQKQRLASVLKKRLQREVRLHCDVDAALIGGAIVRSGDLVIDGSLRARLERLAMTITS
jgi:F-type H+-transporting ATPase subunit delta